MSELINKNITVSLPDSDYIEFVNKCSEHGLTPSAVLSEFMSDFVDGVASGGSDEFMYANNWFHRRYR